ncbi:MAG: hypothetical protein Q4G27_00740 [Flavobacteriaceae bacterium]|nr:hypothetical protein [Flavobacteriaceae bacterium]
MMKEDQKQFLFRYIVSRDLTVDLAIEIFDHMAAQIQQLMDDGLDFEDALEDVKDSWHYDLKVNPNLIFAYNKSKLNQRMKWSLMWAIVKKSAIIGLCMAIIFTVFAIQFNTMYVLYFSAGILILYVILHFTMNFKFIKNWTRLRKKYDNYLLSVYDEGMAIVPVGVLLPQLFFWDFNFNKSFDVNIFDLVIYFSLLFFIYFTAVYTYFSFKKLKEVSSRIQDFLPYLYANRFYD